MKKLLIFSLLLMMFGACSKDNENEQEKLPSTKEELKELLTQKWGVEDNTDYKTFYFFENNTYKVVKNNNAIQTGTYEIDDDLSKIILNGFGEIKLLQLDNDKLYFNSNSKSISCVKQSIKTTEKIFYLVDEESIYSCDLDGSNVKIILQLDYIENFYVHPDGYKILFTNEVNDIACLYSMEINGSNVQKIDTPNDLEYALFTPDAKTIVYRDAIDLYTMTPDGKNITKLTNAVSGESSVGDFGISPDGKKIVYCMWENEANKNSLCIIDINGSNNTIIENNEYYYSPQFSPDGKNIAYASRYGKLLAISNIEGKEERILVTMEEGKGYVDYPYWNKKGNKLIFTQDNLLDHKSSFSVINTDGTGLVIYDVQGAMFQPASISE